jgi:hypothetical protein
MGKSNNLVLGQQLDLLEKLEIELKVLQKLKKNANIERASLQVLQRSVIHNINNLRQIFTENREALLKLNVQKLEEFFLVFFQEREQPKEFYTVAYDLIHQLTYQTQCQDNSKIKESLQNRIEQSFSCFRFLISRNRINQIKLTNQNDLRNISEQLRQAKFNGIDKNVVTIGLSQSHSDRFDDIDFKLKNFNNLDEMKDLTEIKNNKCKLMDFTHLLFFYNNIKICPFVSSNMLKKLNPSLKIGLVVEQADENLLNNLKYMNYTVTVIPSKKSEEQDCHINRFILD